MKKILLSLAVVALFTVRANADVLANYPFTGSLKSSTDSDPNSTASAITDGAGLTTGSTVDATRGNPSPALGVVSTDTDGSSNAAAVTANDYISFTLSPGSGFVLNLSTLTVDAANYTNDGTFPAVSFFLRSSANAFASNIGSTQNILAGSNGAFAASSFDLSGASFQGLSAPIEFRIYFQDSTTDPDRGILLDNIVINGTAAPAAVPEPATWMLMGVGLLFGAQRLRRKQS